LQKKSAMRLHGALTEINLLYLQVDGKYCEASVPEQVQIIEPGLVATSGFNAMLPVTPLPRFWNATVILPSAPTVTFVTLLPEMVAARP
jgi:hypothetical protein